MSCSTTRKAIAEMAAESALRGGANPLTLGVALVVVGCGGAKPPDNPLVVVVAASRFDRSVRLLLHLITPCRSRDENCSTRPPAAADARIH